MTIRGSSPYRWLSCRCSGMLNKNVVNSDGNVSNSELWDTIVRWGLSTCIHFAVVFFLKALVLFTLCSGEECCKFRNLLYLQIFWYISQRDLCNMLLWWKENIYLRIKCPFGTLCICPLLDLCVSSTCNALLILLQLQCSWLLWWCNVINLLKNINISFQHVLSLCGYWSLFSY